MASVGKKGRLIDLIYCKKVDKLLPRIVITVQLHFRQINKIKKIPSQCNVVTFRSQPAVDYIICTVQQETMRRG